jgi:hypothetical protein
MSRGGWAGWLVPVELLVSDPSPQQFMRNILVSVLHFCVVSPAACSSAIGLTATYITVLPALLAVTSHQTSYSVHRWPVLFANRTADYFKPSPDSLETAANEKGSFFNECNDGFFL